MISQENIEISIQIHILTIKKNMNLKIIREVPTCRTNDYRPSLKRVSKP